jgi:hypothetical protein
VPSPATAACRPTPRRRTTSAGSSTWPGGAEWMPCPPP